MEKRKGRANENDYELRRRKGREGRMRKRRSECLFPNKVKEVVGGPGCI